MWHHKPLPEGPESGVKRIVSAYVCVWACSALLFSVHRTLHEPSLQSPQDLSSVIRASPITAGLQ